MEPLTQVIITINISEVSLTGQSTQFSLSNFDYVYDYVYRPSTWFCIIIYKYIFMHLSVYDFYILSWIHPHLVNLLQRCIQIN